MNAAANPGRAISAHQVNHTACGEVVGPDPHPRRGEGAVARGRPQPPPGLAPLGHPPQRTLGEGLIDWTGTRAPAGDGCGSGRSGSSPREGKRAAERVHRGRTSASPSPWKGEGLGRGWWPCDNIPGETSIIWLTHD